MEFRLELDIKPAPEKINLGNRIFLIGSCFTEHISQRFSQFKFPVISNPAGILFNPVSLTNTLTRCISGKPYNGDNLFENQGLWTSWDHHSQFSNGDRTEALEEMNRSLRLGHQFLKEADWLIITFGSAFVYQLENGYVVANCHKMPAAHFQKRLLQAEEIMVELDNLLYRLFLFNPKLRVIFTISPVRHLRDGFVENNQSKALLISSVHHLVNKFSKLYYFPAYELVIDDLRDYRFYAEDMVHPNYQATEYVWDKFSNAFIEGKTREVFKSLQKLRAAVSHRPLHPESKAHRDFLQKHLEQTKELQEQYPFLDFSEEINYFSF